MLTARGRPEDVLKGFAAGADDYLPKPTELAILLARIGGLLRRSSGSVVPPISYTFAGKTIDFDTLELRVGERTLPLTLMEANLLRYLIAHEGKAVSRKAMLEDVWAVHEDTDTRAIDNFIVRLRRYIEKDSGKPRHLLTVRGVGYRFVAEPSRAVEKPLQEEGRKEELFDEEKPSVILLPPFLLWRSCQSPPSSFVTPAAPRMASAAGAPSTPATAEWHLLRRLIVRRCLNALRLQAYASAPRRLAGRRGSRAR